MTKTAKTVTNISKLSQKQFVSNIRHQRVADWDRFEDVFSGPRSDFNVGTGQIQVRSELIDLAETYQKAFISRNKNDEFLGCNNCTIC